jgi:uncharacterized protein GlcG (DUF336 family)
MTAGRSTRSATHRVCAPVLSLMLGVVSMVPATAGAQGAGLFSARSLTLETATRAAQAALDSCRKSGYQVGVAVVDRSGIPQVFLRDRFAGPHTVKVAIDKAWTSVTFKMPTTELAKETQPGSAMSGIREVPRVTAFGGGIPIEAGGSIVGGIGVSGAPGGGADDTCAKAGIDAILMDIEL